MRTLVCVRMHVYMCVQMTQTALMFLCHPTMALADADDVAFTFSPLFIFVPAMVLATADVAFLFASLDLIFYHMVIV